MRSLLASLGAAAASAQSIPDAPWTAMEVDVPLNITLAPGECAAFRLELLKVLGVAFHDAAERCVGDRE